MKLLSIEHIPGVEFEALGMVKGTVVYSKNFGKDFMAAMKTLKELGADAVIGVRYGSSQVMNGAAEVIAYGTAVKYLKQS